MGPPTGNRWAPGATSGPLFPSNMTLQESNWVGPIFICGFRVAAKLAFSDRPLAPWGPNKGQKGPFGATHAKNGQRPLGETTLRGRLSTNPENSKG